MRKHKKFTSLIIFMLTTVLLSMNFSVFATDFNLTTTPESQCVYMAYVGENGDIPVVNSNADSKTYPASLTKMMTAVVLLENYNYNELENIKVTVPPEAFEDFYVDGVYQNPSTAGFKKGEEVDLKDLLYGMMLQSACEAANIIAYYVGGESVSNFITMMNETAQRIGATNTNFTNPHGLFDENQYTTAYDMYRIARYAIGLDGFMEVVSTQNYKLKVTNMHATERTVIHTNYMMSQYLGGTKYYYPYVKGIKTGTLDECGRNLVSTATKDGYTYLLVTLGGPLTDAEGQTYYSNFADHKKLYEWAFDNLELSKIINSGTDIMEFPVRNSSGKDYVIATAKDDYITLLPENIDKARITYELPEAKKINAPISSGDKLGEMKVYVDGDYLTSVDLIAGRDVKLSVYKYILWIIWVFLSSKIFRILLIIIAILIAVYVFAFYKKNKDKRNKRVKRQQMR